MRYAEINLRQECIELLPGLITSRTHAEWVGPIHLPVRISRVHELAGTVFPWPLHKVADDPAMPASAIYVRGDCGYPWLRMVYRLAWRWRMSLIANRLILTAHVWGLARVPYGAVPSWSDVYLIARINNVLAKLSSRFARKHHA